MIKSFSRKSEKCAESKWKSERNKSKRRKGNFVFPIRHTSQSLVYRIKNRQTIQVERKKNFSSYSFACSIPPKNIWCKCNHIQLNLLAVIRLWYAIAFLPFFTVVSAVLSCARSFRWRAIHSHVPAKILFLKITLKRIFALRTESSCHRIPIYSHTISFFLCNKRCRRLVPLCWTELKIDLTVLRIIDTHAIQTKRKRADKWANNKVQRVQTVK